VDVLWSPWRYDYIKSGSETAPERSGGCVFCDILNNPASDEEKFILKRAGFNFVILNIYPYVSGHVMVVPYDHIADLDKASKETSDEMMDLTKRCQTALRETYSPDGINLGMNLGKAAGAGVAGRRLTDDRAIGLRALSVPSRYWPWRPRRSLPAIPATTA